MLRPWFLAVATLVLPLIAACEGCDTPWHEGESPPVDAGRPTDAGTAASGDAGFSDGGPTDAGESDAGSPDGGPDDLCRDVKQIGDLPAPQWRDFYPFDRDSQTKPGGIGRDAYWVVDESLATVVTGLLGRLQRPELAADVYPRPEVLLHTVESGSGETTSLTTLRASIVVSMGQSRPRGAIVAPLGAYTGELHLPSGTVISSSAPFITPFSASIAADGSIVEPLWRMRLSSVGLPDTPGATGGAMLAHRPSGGQASVFFYRGVDASIERLGLNGLVESTIPMPDFPAVDLSGAFFIGRHDATGALDELRRLEVSNLAAPLALDDMTLLFLETEAESFRYDEQTYALPEGVTSAILALDANHDVAWVRPMAGEGRLEDLIEVGADRFCAELLGDGQLMHAPEAWADPLDLPDGQLGSHVVCFDMDGWFVGAAAVDLGRMHVGLAAYQEVTLDRVAGGVAVSAGFHGALRADDGRGGVLELEAAGGPEDLDGVLLRFDGDARLVEGRHLGTPYDAYFSALAEVGDDILVLGAFRECLPLRREDGTIEVIRQSHPEIDGMDGFIARFPNILRP